ncbi:hypothetical protein PTKU64_25510 [Paraburkholderia terrae]|uniref:Uncharacterized protein n=1 Tax=Paraburkholderia terrae TaxID=311230 RepID=A0ABM7TIS1_9BURK|nr:hypothetical protein PTKU64_25510 [Paraburkholderia terrae]
MQHQIDIAREAELGELIGGFGERGFFRGGGLFRAFRSRHTGLLGHIRIRLAPRGAALLRSAVIVGFER